MISSKLIKDNKTYVLVLALSLMLFVFKGIQYALIDSYFPALFIILVLTLFYFANRSSTKNLSRLLKFWGLFLVLWAFLRFFIEISFMFSEKITETHIRDQFTIIHKTISFVVFLVGSYIIRKRLNFVNNSQ